MSLPGFLAKGLDIADLVELSAPMPWLLLATTDDYFTPEGAGLAYNEARRWYGLYGAEDKVRFFVGPGPHGTPLETREAIYKWMIDRLEGGSGDFHEQPAKLYTNQELLVTQSGNVDDEPGSRKLYQLILDDFHARKRPGTTSDLLAELRRLGVPSEGPPPAVKIVDDSDTPDYRLDQVRFEGEPGVEIAGKLYIPKSAGRKPAVLLLEDKPLPVPLHVSKSPPTAPLAQAIARSGRVVLELEPRGAPPAVNGPPFIGDWLSNARANLIGRNLPAMRAHDILRGVDVLAARSDVDAASIRGFARGVKGVWLLLAAAIDPRLGKIWLDRTPFSLRAALESSMSVNLFDAVIPGFSLRWDLDDLTKAMGNRTVLWTDPTNWMDHPVSVGPRFRYRYILGDLTERSGVQDDEYMREFFK
jgi:hypothetical protein